MKAVGTSPDLVARTLVIALATPFLSFEKRPAGLLLMPEVANEIGVKLRSPFSSIIEKVSGPATIPQQAAPPDVSRLKRVMSALVFALMLLGMLAGIVAFAVFVEYPYIIKPAKEAPGVAATWLCTLAFTSQACNQAGFVYLEYTALLMVIGSGIADALTTKAS